MDIFENHGRVLKECLTEKEYYSAVVVSGRYSSDEGFSVVLRPYGSLEFRFFINDPVVLNKTLSAYLTQSKVGLVLNETPEILPNLSNSFPYVSTFYQIFNAGL